MGIDPLRRSAGLCARPADRQGRGRGRKTFDSKERARILQAAIDRNHEMVYILPIASLPTVLVHAKNVRVDNLLAANGVEIADYSWK